MAAVDPDALSKAVLKKCRPFIDSFVKDLQAELETQVRACIQESSFASISVAPVSSVAAASPRTPLLGKTSSPVPKQRKNRGGGGKPKGAVTIVSSLASKGAKGTSLLSLPDIVNDILEGPSLEISLPENCYKDFARLCLEPCARLLQIQTEILDSLEPGHKGIFKRVRDDVFRKDEMFTLAECARYMLDRLHSGMSLYGIIRSEAHLYQDLFFGEGLSGPEALRTQTMLKLLHILHWMVMSSIPMDLALEYRFSLESPSHNFARLGADADLVARPLPDALRNCPLADVTDLRRYDEWKATVPDNGKVDEKLSRIHPDWLSVNSPLSIIGKDYAFTLGMGLDRSVTAADPRAKNLAGLEGKIQAYYESTLSGIMLKCTQELELAKAVQLKVASTVTSLSVILFNLVMRFLDAKASQES